MQRCIQLAGLGAGFTAPNPMVGAVLVHNNRIIGEGYHKYFGEAHAEVNCIADVLEQDRPLIRESTLYVSLEPCCFQGKTPPCTELILREKIPRVVIGCRDPFPMVNGKGIEILISAGVQVDFPVMEKQSIELNRRFFIFHQQQRPYIVLKWAESANHKISGVSGIRTQISNNLTNRLVHKWRSEEAGILIGTNTALLDNPKLTSRLYAGKNPVRIVLDRKLRLPDNLNIFDQTTKTIVLNESTYLNAGNILFRKLIPGRSEIWSVLSTLYEEGILSVLVEGGAKILQFFIDAGIWDEARIISNQKLIISNGTSAPDLKNGQFQKTETQGTDLISYYKNKTPEE